MKAKIIYIIIFMAFLTFCEYKCHAQSIKSYIPSATCIFIAGLSDGLRDASMYRMDGYGNWWNGKDSWLNKYKNHDIKQGPAFWGSTSIFVPITDAPHASDLLTHQADNMAALLMPVDNNKRFWHLMLKAGAETLIRTSAHYFMYDIVFKPQGRD